MGYRRWREKKGAESTRGWRGPTILYPNSDSRETKIQIYSRQINVHVTLSYIRCMLLEVVCVDVLMSTEDIAWRHKLNGTVALEINSIQELQPPDGKKLISPQSKCYIISNIWCLTKKPTHSFCFMPPICFITDCWSWFKQQILLWFSQLLSFGHVSIYSKIHPLSPYWSWIYIHWSIVGSSTDGLYIRMLYCFYLL